MTEKVEELKPNAMKDLYFIYVDKVLPKGSTSRKERAMLFAFASFIDNIIEGKTNEQKES